MRSALMALALLLCGCSAEPRLRIGSKNFSEQYLLGEILARHVSNRLHIRISRRFGIGGALPAHQALLNGDLDLYPEYTGTALLALLKQKLDTDPVRVLAKVREAYHAFGVEWIDPLGFENTYAMAVRQDSTASTTLSSASAEKPWRLGIGYEFESAPDGLPSLRTTYGFRVAGKPKTMDLGLLYQALSKKQVDMVAGNSTDGLLAVLGLKVLEDDRRAFPPFDCAVVVRSAALARYPGLREALAALSGRINADTMRRLNYELDGKHRPAREIARDFLRSVGLER